MICINYKVLLLIVLLFSIGLSQRGGSSRSSSRSSSSRRSSSSSRSSSSGYFGTGRRHRRGKGGSIFDWFSSDQNDQNITGSTNSTLHGSEQQQDSQGNGLIWTTSIFGVFGLLAYYGHTQQKKKQQLRLTRIQQEFTTFQGEKEANSCTLNDQQMINLKNWFMGRRWTVYFQTNDRTFRDSAAVTLKNIKQRGRLSHNFQMSMIDSIGNSSSRGILVHTGNYFSINFQKTYSNRNQAGQTGTFDLLLYKGVQQGQCFRGQWYYKGYELDNRYSGTWQMTHL